MHDFAAIWSSQPEWRMAALKKPGLSARTLPVSQHLISGDLAAWARGAEFPENDIGGFGLAAGDRYSLRLARDRILVVGPAQFTAAPGWRMGGFAVTPISAGLIVFEMTGPLLPELVARATTLDPSKTSPSAAMSFAGAQAIVYRHDDPGNLRVHIDRPMGSYFWTWLAAVSEAISPTEGRNL